MQATQQDHSSTQPETSSKRRFSPTQLADSALHQLSSRPAWVVLIQLFIGLGWMRAGTEKLISGSWWTGAELTEFLAEHDGQTLIWYRPFVEAVVFPAAPVVALVVMVVQFALGVALLTNRRLGTALAIGMFLNLNFIAAGAVNPSVFYLISQSAVLLWMADTLRDRSTQTTLQSVMAAGLVLAVLNVPWIQTMHPSDVIDDPALMLVTAGSLAALCSYLAQRRWADSIVPQPCRW